jgi:streptomycin 6-kinase
VSRADGAIWTGPDPKFPCRWHDSSMNIPGFGSAQRVEAAKWAPGRSLFCLTAPRPGRQRVAMTAFAVPRYLAETARRDEGVSGWIAGLPAIVADLARRWSLEVGEPFQPGGQCSWTAPVTNQAGACMVLKVGFRFPGGEERDEAAGLRLWDGNGAVRLHAACESESAYALLIERCLPGTPLGQMLPEPEQDLVVARLLRQLWAQPHTAYQFRPLAQMCAAWAEEFEQEYADAPAADRIDPGLARTGIALFRALPQTAGSRVLLCTDLHGDNILAAQRAPWLVIDPKPYIGDPAYDVLQHMLNCEDRLAADPARLASRMAALAGVDVGRVRQWLFARSVQESIGSPLMREVARQLAPA